MAKIDFIVSRTDKEDGGYTFENYFLIDGKEATFEDVSANDKFIMFEGIKKSLGVLARITLMDMGINPDEQQKD